MGPKSPKMKFKSHSPSINMLSLSLMEERDFLIVSIFSLSQTLQALNIQPVP